MLVIRSREELRQHLERQRQMYVAQMPPGGGGGSAMDRATATRIGGTIAGIDVALEAWDRHAAARPAKAALTVDMAARPAVIRPFVADYFGVGTAGFQGLCSHCNQPATWMAQIYWPKGRSRLVALCAAHSVRMRNAVFVDAPASATDQGPA